MHRAARRDGKERRGARIARVADRDGVLEDQVRRIIAAQLSQGQRMTQADDLIWNDGSERELRARVSALHQQYLEAPPEG